MRIAGLDLSINSPGAYVLELDENLEVTASDFRGVTDVKKNVSERVSFLDKKSFGNYIDKDLWVASQIISLVSSCDYAAIEGPAYGATGRLFEIAQATCSVKYPLYSLGVALRVYDPLSIKIFATGDGGANKIEMFQRFLEVKGEETFREMGLPVVNKEKGVSPTSDIIDAFWIAHLLLTELKLRRGLIELKGMPEKMIKVFNRVTKAYPENILSTNFLEKK